MNSYELKLDVESKDIYETALKSLLEADKAIAILTQCEKQKLLDDYIKYKITGEFHDVVKQNYR